MFKGGTGAEFGFAYINPSFLLVMVLPSESKLSAHSGEANSRTE